MMRCHVGHYLRATAISPTQQINCGRDVLSLRKKTLVTVAHTRSHVEATRAHKYQRGLVDVFIRQSQCISPDDLKRLKLPSNAAHLLAWSKCGQAMEKHVDDRWSANR